MNDIAKSAQNIKRFFTADMSENKAAGIWEIFGIDFNNFTLRDHMLDLGKSYAAAITASLAMPRDLKRAAVNFSSDFFNHRIIFSRQRVTQEVWGCQAIRHSFGIFALISAVFRILGLDNFLIHSPTVQDQPCPPRRFAAKAAGRGV